MVNDNFVKQTQAPKEKSNNQICVLLQSWIHALDAPVHQVKYTFDLIHMAFTMWRKNNFSTGMLMDTYEDRGGKAINSPQAIGLEILKQMCSIYSYQTAITNIHTLSI